MRLWHSDSRPGSASVSRAGSHGASLFAASILFAGLSSCSLPGDFGLVLAGNSRFKRGDYEAAAASYLAVHTPGWRAAVDYDLANTWAELGEAKAAEKLYAQAVKEGDRGLRHDAWYNLGILRLEGGRWEEAWRAFRESLRLDATDKASRRGLEIAWRAWKKEGSTAPSLPSPAAGADFPGVIEDLKLLRRLERGSWRPGAGPGTAEGGRDW